MGSEFSLVLTKLIAMMEAKMPAAEIKTGKNAPSRLKHIAPRVIAAIIEPT